MGRGFEGWLRVPLWRAALLACVLLASTTMARGAVTDPASTVDGLQGEKGHRRIELVGAVLDQPDLSALRLGTAGWWFPQFDAAGAVTGAPTGDNARDALPAWVAAFNHTASPADPGCTEPDALARGCLPTYAFRTFSQDGPARSAGGIDGWSTLRLPSGECGRSGAIVDPQTFTGGPNNNNTINRIQLQDGVPTTFHVSVLTDNTGNDHDPGRLEVRGNVGLLDVPSEVADSQVEPVFPRPVHMRFNGVPDLYVFRVSGFVTGDYLKLRLRGLTSAASFGGLLFDETLDPAPPHLRGNARAARGAPVTVDCAA